MSECQNHPGVDHRLTELEQQMHALAERLQKLEVASGRNDEKISRIFDDIDSLKSIMRDISSKLDTIIQKPGKRWDGVIEKFLTVVVGIIVGMLFKGLTP